jgi:hypothetical protein
MLADLSKMYSVPIDLDYLFNQYRNDYHMHFHHNEDEAYDIGQSESITLKKIYDDAQNEDKRIVYFHSKGVTSYFDRVAPIAIKEHKLNCDVRHYLNWGVLERWRECVDALETHDTAGISLIREPLQYYAGNFWWTKSSHIRNLLDPGSFEWKQRWQQMNHNVGNKFYKRCGDEMWLCSNNPTSYDIQGRP